PTVPGDGALGEHHDPDYPATTPNLNYPPYPWATPGAARGGPPASRDTDRGNILTTGVARCATLGQCPVLPSPPRPGVPRDSPWARRWCSGWASAARSGP